MGCLQNCLSSFQARAQKRCLAQLGFFLSLHLPIPPPSQPIPFIPEILSLSFLCHVVIIKHFSPLHLLAQYRNLAHTTNLYKWHLLLSCFPPGWHLCHPQKERERERAHKWLLSLVWKKSPFWNRSVFIFKGLQLHPVVPRRDLELDAIVIAAECSWALFPTVLVVQTWAFNMPISPPVFLFILMHWGKVGFIRLTCLMYVPWGLINVCKVLWDPWMEGARKVLSTITFQGLSMALWHNKE